ncbi:hypothetical protein TVAG_178150 [Trichomonas vaginalis G3]|uniref:F5/8 type C domain containing protein n=1 Tax=Trichomonas vaginalis (strain ATCC PRA-98 / G3) TaxID=412133 RepID=A2DIG7_TRIV3|nr:protein ubiquitination [Trichomonas vaginalis G3]EAY19771.1 hypothetical protein TVAG_178150 [Trichomonas vaginalis G3]KAI5523913.1 protein ubiquitination [Trichomonas vaginalis G3]|eukprot:XP_001580757.1 hypothetical protein [Trichomonas vaginalis G3]
MSFSLSSNGLANIAALPVNEEDNFVINIGSIQFNCAKYVAAFISPIITKLLKEDQLISSFLIDTSCNNPTMIESFMAKLLSGQKFDINSQNSKYIKEIGTALQNSEIVESVDKAISTKSTYSPKNIIQIIKEKSNHTLNITDEVDYAAKNISFLPRSELLDLDLDLIDQILSSPNLLIENEDWLAELIFDICKSNENQNAAFLFHNINFEYLSTSGVTRFLKVVNHKNLTGPVWSALTQRLTHDIVQSTIDVKRYFTGFKPEETIVDDKVKKIEFTGNPFEGIIHEMTKETGQNPHAARVVEITSSSKERSHPWNILDYNWTGWFYTRNIPDSWIQMDFKNKRIAPTWYSIKSDGNSCSHIKNWVLEGSDDATNWSMVDEQRDNSILNGQFNVGTFKCSKSRFYRYFRIRQIDLNTSGNNYLGMCNFEMFGSIKDNVE